MLLLRLPEGLSGQIMLEAVRMNCQRAGYLENFDAGRSIGQHRGLSCASCCGHEAAWCTHAEDAECC